MKYDITLARRRRSRKRQLCRLSRLRWRQRWWKGILSICQEKGQWYDEGEAYGMCDTWFVWYTRTFPQPQCTHSYSQPCWDQHRNGLGWKQWWCRWDHWQMCWKRQAGGGPLQRPTPPSVWTFDTGAMGKRRTYLKRRGWVITLDLEVTADVPYAMGRVTRAERRGDCTCQGGIDDGQIDRRRIC